MNRCLFTHLHMYPQKREEVIKHFLSQYKDIDESQIISDKPLPFENGKLAPIEYFYSLFDIEELTVVDVEKFKPKIFLVTDETLDNKTITLGNLILVKLMYVDTKRSSGEE